MADDAGEKTEQPTGNKLGKARQQGNVPRSQEVSHVFVLLGAGGALILMRPLGWEKLLAYVRYSLWAIPEFDISTVDLWPLMQTAFREALLIVIPFAFFILIISVAINVYQLGGFLSIPLSFKIDKLNFINGFKRFFKLKALVDAIKHTLKLVVIFYVSYRIIKEKMGIFSSIGDMDPAQMGLLTLQIAVEVFLRYVFY